MVVLMSRVAVKSRHGTPTARGEGTGDPPSPDGESPVPANRSSAPQLPERLSPSALLRPPTTQEPRAILGCGSSPSSYSPSVCLASRPITRSVRVSWISHTTRSPIVRLPTPGGLCGAGAQHHDLLTCFEG